MNGKGDTPRPLSIDQETFSQNWDRIFGKKTQESVPEEYTKMLASGMFFELFPQLTGNWNTDKNVWYKSTHNRLEMLGKLEQISQEHGLYDTSE